MAFLVREAFPSITTGVEVTSGVLDENDSLVIVSEMNEGGPIFGDGIEDDSLQFGWGQRAEVKIARECLRLVAA